jgi:hypothetical protein
VVDVADAVHVERVQQDLFGHVGAFERSNRQRSDASRGAEPSISALLMKDGVAGRRAQALCA